LVGFKIAVNDALLVRVLHRAANVAEQLEPLPHGQSLASQ